MLPKSSSTGSTSSATVSGSPAAKARSPAIGSNRVPASEVTGIRPFLLLPAALLTLLLAYLFFPGRRNRRSYRRAFLCGTLIGCAAFFVSFGWKVLDPERTAWLLGGGDPTQHYLGWVALPELGLAFPARADRYARQSP